MCLLLFSSFEENLSAFSQPFENKLKIIELKFAGAGYYCTFASR